ncbi:MAG: class I SAM-dependent methyltransferase [Planctomycetota bacterium]
MRGPACLARLHEPAFAWDRAIEAAASDGDHRPTWAYAWPTGDRLAQDLTRLIDCRGLGVADLGCGRGHGGLAALLAGCTRALFADASPHPLGWVEAVLEANALSDRAQTRVHRWGTPLPQGPWDLIIGGDILYRPECFAALLDTLMASLAPEGCALLADPRQGLEPELVPLAEARGLKWDAARQASGYTLVRVWLTPSRDRRPRTAACDIRDPGCAG